jgi:diguanylate cyclase (GGDEF)-like protein
LELRKANDNLLNAKAQLEHRDSERSVKLLKANAAIQEEVARRIASEDKIAYLAHHDTLTGLPNRFTFDEKLSAARQFARDRGSQLSLLFIDLDGFKNVNDTLGHAIGDELLREIASRLMASTGVNDFCARLGGDEFAIVHISKDARSTAGALAERMIATLCGCHLVGGNQVFIGASIGISVLYGGDSDTAALLKQADLAMYRAKDDGRGVYRFFEPQMAVKAEMRRSLELDLREAVARSDFQLYYQPVIDLKARRVTGFEALMRWNHRERGFVPPVEFISLAEDTGLIVPMGEWAIRQACADAASWPGELRVAINLSPVQFRKMNLTSVILDALDSSGLPPARLELEITESVMLGNLPQNIQILERLHSVRQGEDRPVVREGDDGASGEPSDHPSRDRTWREHGHFDYCRRRRDDRTTPEPHGRGLHRSSGLFLQQAGAESEHFQDDRGDRAPRGHVESPLRFAVSNAAITSRASAGKALNLRECARVAMQIEDCRVEDGAVAWAYDNAPSPFPAHPIGRADFPHPAFRQTSRRAHSRLAALAGERGRRVPRVEACEGSPDSGLRAAVAVTAPRDPRERSAFQTRRRPSVRLSVRQESVVRSV